MIFFPDIKAFCKCEGEGCEAALALPVLMTIEGTFGVAAEGWQFLPGRSGLFHTFCPLHHQEIPQAPLVQPIPRGVQIGPRGPRLMNGKRG